jgi:hypothetical protein
VALNADGLAVEQSMCCFQRFTAKGEVRLGGAHIGGRLSFSEAVLNNPDGIALFADGLTVDRDMLCSKGFTAKGEVRLVGAQIGGDLDLSGANLVNSEGLAFNARRLVVDQSMFCRRLSAKGEVNLLGAHIGGDLSLIEASLTNPGPGRFALMAARMTIDGVMFCRDGFTAHGEVRLIRARIGGFLDCSGARLSNPNANALSAYGLHVGQDIFCDALNADGQVNFLGVHTGGNLNLNGATLAPSP